MTHREQEILQLIAQNPMVSQQELADELNISRASVAVHISNLLKKGYIAGKGYVLRADNYAAIVGGVNVDIGGQADHQLRLGDSNPGRVTVSLGGVGRNIAHNLSLLGANVHLLTAFGQDAYGERIVTSCGKLGIDISHALKMADMPTSTYLYIAEPSGEMSVALSDMQVCNEISPAYLAANVATLQNAQVVVADANIPEASLVYLAEKCTAPLFCDPVSVAKAEKLLPILDKIHTLKPNRLEAELLSGVKITTKADVEQAAKALLDKGVKRVFISMGAEGVYAATKDQQLWRENLPGRMVGTTGCGDAFMAALVWAYLEGLSLEHTALAGLAAGAISMESAETINSAMSVTALKNRMNAHKGE